MRRWPTTSTSGGCGSNVNGEAMKLRAALVEEAKKPRTPSWPS